MHPARKPDPAESTSGDPWVSVRAAALTLGVSRQTIYNWCVAGSLEFTRIADRVVISKLSVEAQQLAQQSEAGVVD